MTMMQLLGCKNIAFHKFSIKAINLNDGFTENKVCTLKKKTVKYKCLCHKQSKIVIITSLSK